MRKQVKPEYSTTLQIGDRVTVFQAMDNHIARYHKFPGTVSHFTKKKIAVLLDDGRLAAVFPDNVQKVSEG